MKISVDAPGNKRWTANHAPKFDDREGRVTEDSYAYRMGIREHVPSPANKRLRDLVLNSNPKAMAYVVDRDGAQKMANSKEFFVQKVPLGQARDRGMWIVMVDTGTDTTNFLPASAMKAIHDAAEEGTEVPRRRWPHNAFRAED